MSFTGKNIYELLPQIYRIRDIEQDNALKEFIDIIAREATVTEANIAELYENWFIETCKEWLVPYIGDLLGVRGLHAITGSNVISQRAYVANTLSYRRRKGIAPVLEQLSLDVAGWRAHVTEFFELLETSQYMNHIRLRCSLTPDLRRMNQLDLLNSAFDTITHSADMRHISSGRGRYNIPNIGLYIWRIQSYPVSKADARKVDCVLSTPDPTKYFFTFSPLGCNTQLFNRPQTETDITHISEEINVPGLLRSRALFDELEARRQAIVDDTTAAYNYFDDRLAIEDDPSTKKHPVFEIFPEGSDEPVPPEKILICNLAECCSPALTRPYKKLMSDGTYTTVDMPIDVVVDPVAGRFIFTTPVTKATVSYSYGFSGDLGAGIYNMQGSLSAYLQSLNFPQKQVSRHIGVSKTINTVGSETIYPTLQEAIADWNLLNATSPGGVTAVITIMDNHSYEGAIDIEIGEKSHLMIVAAQWPVREDTETLPPLRKRLIGDFTIGGLRPHINADITVKGLTALDKQTGGSLTLNGLLIEGKLSVLEGNLGDLVLAHCTLVPNKGGLEAGAGSPADLSNQWLKLNILSCITGPIILNNTSAVSLAVEDCIIDDPAAWAIDAVNTPATFKRTTVLGKTHVKTINAENCIFNELVKAERRQTGCLRFSFAPLVNSETPRRYHCQPDFEINSQVEEAEKNGPISNAAKTVIRNTVIQWLVPGFRSTKYCHYGYAQLNANCPEQINSGADDGSEMGSFSFLKQPQRMANLRIALDEYLPLGLEAGFIYVT